MGRRVAGEHDATIVGLDHDMTVEVAQMANMFVAGCGLPSLVEAEAQDRNEQDTGGDRHGGRSRRPAIQSMPVVSRATEASSNSIG